MLAAIWMIVAAHAGALGPLSDDPLVDEMAASPIDQLPTDGAPRCNALRDAVHLSETAPDLFRFADPINTWGTEYLTSLIVAAGQEMKLLEPEADPILVGDLSSRGGGPLAGHISHQFGTDADIGLYGKGGKQQFGGFVRMTPSTLDLEANWLLLKSFLDSGRIEFILLDPALISALRTWTVETRRLTQAEADTLFPAEGTPRLWERTGYVRGARNHDDHMHVRVRCDEEASPR